MNDRLDLPLALSEQEISAAESILLVAGGPVSISALAAALQLPRRRMAEVLQALQERRVSSGIRLQISGEEAQLVSAPENVEAVQRFLGTVRPAPLSRPALEALAIIAYHQPATRAEIEAMRGINSDRAVQTLLARGLIEEIGERATAGRPREFGTSFGFLEYFGLSSLDELPPLERENPATDISATNLGMRRKLREED